MSANDLSDTIRDTAKAPARVSVDGTTVDAQKVADQILAEQHLAGQTGAGKNHFGMRFAKLEPPRAG